MPPNRGATAPVFTGAGWTGIGGLGPAGLGEVPSYIRAPGRDGWFRLPAQSGAQYDPARQLEMLRSISNDVRLAGTAPVTVQVPDPAVVQDLPTGG
jgi:hypothetical protein